jgi:hypothetical protein
MNYPPEIIEAVKIMVAKLADHYPIILQQKYDNSGFVDNTEKGNTFEERMKMGVYMELIKARAII